MQEHINKPQSPGQNLGHGTCYLDWSISRFYSVSSDVLIQYSKIDQFRFFSQLFLLNSVILTVAGIKTCIIKKRHLMIQELVEWVRVCAWPLHTHIYAPHNEKWLSSRRIELCDVPSRYASLEGGGEVFLYLFTDALYCFGLSLSVLLQNALCVSVPESPHHKLTHVCSQCHNKRPTIAYGVVGCIP